MCLFWIIYFFEKNLSVRLGRSSFILDRDIEDPLPEQVLGVSAHLQMHRVPVVSRAVRKYCQLTLQASLVTHHRHSVHLEMCGHAEHLNYR
jgi:hypothetical protein